MPVRTGLTPLTTKLATGLSPVNGVAATPWTAAGIASIMGVSAPTHYWEFSGASPFTDTVGGVVLTKNGFGVVNESTASANFGRDGVEFPSGTVNTGYKAGGATDLSINNVSAIILLIFDGAAYVNGQDFCYAYNGVGGSHWRFTTAFPNGNVAARFDGGTADAETLTSTQSAPHCFMVRRDMNANQFAIYDESGDSTFQTIESTGGVNTAWYFGGSQDRGGDPAFGIYMAMAVWIGTTAEEDFVTGHAALCTNLGL